MMNKFNNNGEKYIMTTGTIKGIDAFADTVKTVMEAYYGNGYEVQTHKIVKNNDIHLNALIIKNQKVNIAPSIYLDNYYEMYMEGKSMTNICEEIIALYEKYKMTSNFDTSSIIDFNKIKGRICYKLINAEQNKELLKDIPYMKFHDLAIIFFIMVSNEGEGIGTITVRNRFMDLWNVSKNKIFELAVQNTERLFRGKVSSIAEVMMDMLSTKLDEECANEFYDMEADINDMLPMYICTNTTKINGAGVIFYSGILKDFANRMDSDFYIIPSSIHETIFIPSSIRMTVDEIKDMVKTINANEVEPEEVLSDNVYIYHRQTDRVEMV